MDYPLTAELLKKKNWGIIRAITRFVNDNAYNNLAPFRNLRAIIDQFYGIEDVDAYRLTKMGQSSLRLLLQDDWITIKKSRNIRSWTRDKNMALQFVGIGGKFKTAVNLLLHEVIPASEVLVDFSKPIIIKEFRQFRREFSNIGDEWDVNEVEIALPLLLQEKEILRWTKYDRSLGLTSKELEMLILNPKYQSQTIRKLIGDKLVNFDTPVLIKTFPQTDKLAMNIVNRNQLEVVW